MDKKTIKHILNVLRLGTLSWHERNKALSLARKPVQEGFYKNGKPRFKYYYQCAICKDWERDVSCVEVDHKKEVGSFTGDWNKYIKRLYCGVSGLQVLCLDCHREKTSVFNKVLRGKKREKVIADSSEIL